MRSILLTLWLAVLGLVLVCPSVPAADPIDSKPPQPALGGGLNVSLVTNGFSFSAFSVEAPKVMRGRIVTPESKDCFVASVSLSNRSRAPIPFRFNDTGPRWTFRILDSEDRELWKSDAGLVSAQMIRDEALGAGKSWKRSVRIPLVIYDVPLAPGHYTVQAFLNADKSVSATSAFEIVPRVEPTTGIKGTVSIPIYGLTQPTPSATSPTTLPDYVRIPILIPAVIGKEPMAGTRVQIRQIDPPAGKAPFTWSGFTDTQGKFMVSTPPGTFNVWVVGGTPAQPSSPVASSIAPNASATVVVEPNAVANVDLVLSPGCVIFIRN